MLKIFFIYLFLVVVLIAKELPADSNNSAVGIQVDKATQLQAQKESDNTHLTKWLLTNKSHLDQVIQTTVKESKTKWFNEETIKQPADKAQVTPPSKSNISDNFIIYTVKKGDTIYSLARKYNISTDDIITWNNIKSKSSLLIGQKIKIYLYQPESVTNPVAKALDSPKAEVAIKVKNSYPQYSYYKVKQGDSVNIIAKSHNMTANELTILNSLKANQVLSIGMILKVNTNYDKQSISDTSSILKEGFAWPAIGRLIMPFGLQEKGLFNEGINIALRTGTTIKSTQDGIVTHTGNSLKSFGNIVIIQHDNHWLSIYANLSKILVKKGEHVKQGTPIAKSGQTGAVKSAQLHFELRYNIKPMDPLNYLNSYN